MRSKAKKFVSLFLLVFLLASQFTGCDKAEKKETETKVEVQQDTTDTTDTKDLPEMKYSIFYYEGDTGNLASNENDVVSPYIFDKFKVKVEEIVTAGGMTTDEKLMMLAAANNLPDVLLIGLSTDVGTIRKLYDSGKIANLSDYISPEKTPNLYKYVTDSFNAVEFVRSYNENGDLMGFPQVMASEAIPRVAESVYKPQPMYPWSILIRSDILENLGYKFNRLSKLESDLAKNPRPLTEEDLKIEPAIDTPEDFYNLLKSIKDMNLKVGDKSVIPFSMVGWQMYHLSSMYGSTMWMPDPNGEINGFLGHQYSKDFYNYLRVLYQEGLLDPDFSVQKDEQFIQKASSGLIASTIYWAPGDLQMVNAIKETNPDYEWFKIGIPQLPNIKPYTDEQVPCEVIYMVNKNFKDIERLVEYWDWFYSDEAFDIMAWGPESAGLYEVVDGKKRFKDNELWESVKNGITGQKGFDYYGLNSPAMTFKGASIAAVAAPVMLGWSPCDQRNSYPYSVDIWQESQNIVGFKNSCQDGTGSMGNGADAPNITQNFFWVDFIENHSSKLYTSKTEEEFNKAWNEVYSIFLDKGRYEEAKKIMTEFIKSRTK